MDCVQLCGWISCGNVICVNVGIILSEGAWNDELAFLS